jgi:hypothetical protein
MNKVVKSTDSWEPKLTDPYWVKLRDELVEKGIPEFIATPAMTKCQMEEGVDEAYGVYKRTPKNNDIPDWQCESEVN